MMINESKNVCAVVDQSGSVTYGQLHDRVLRFANLFVSHGIKSGDKLAVAMDKNIDLIAVIFAAIIIGAVYVPVSYRDPPRRINEIIKISNIKCIVTGVDTLMHKNDYIVPLLKADASECCDLIAPDKLIYKAHPDDIVYIIFTSGSVGHPKGVQVSHKNLSYMAYGFNDLYFKNYEPSEQINVGVVAPYIFDTSIQQIFPCLMAGHRLFLLSDEEKNDYEKMAQFFEINNIQLTDFTPVFFHNFINSDVFIKHYYSFKNIILAGEKLNRNVIEDFLPLNFSEAVITNAYGPTECTVNASAYTIRSITDINTTSIPIGRPYPNTKLYVLRPNLTLQFIGVAGELYIGGSGVSHGYVNNLMATDGSFINNPFCPGEIIYKTGDIVKWLDDGNLLFLGRDNSQIKLRGFRIDLNEIESALLLKQGIKQVSVQLRNTGNSAFLVSYYTTVDNAQRNDLKSFLEQYLPYYMIPTFFIYMDKLPLTVNGKIDKNMLPDPMDMIDQDDGRYRSEQEREIAGLFKEILNINSVQFEMGFFDHGGNSISAINLINRINQRYFTNISLTDLYEASQIPLISELINKKKTSTANMQILDPEKDIYQSAQQQRLYIAELLTEKTTVNNILEVYEISGLFSVDHAIRAIRGLCKRHESLRTTFYHKADNLYQRVHDEADISVTVHNHRDMPVFDDETLDRVLQQINVSISLDKGPLIDFNIFEFSNDKFLLILRIHHIIFDAASFNILIHDFLTLYNDGKLPDLTSTYRAYSQRQQQFLQSPTFADIKDFWLNRLNQKTTPLPLPVDKHPSKMGSFEGDVVTQRILKSDLASLSVLFSREGLNHFMFLFTCYVTLMHRLTGKNDIIIGTVMSDRNGVDYENVIGVFTHTVPVLVEIDWDLAPKDIRQATKIALISSMKNMHFPYLDMIRSLNLHQDRYNSPIFNVSFNMAEYLPFEEHLSDQSIHFRQRMRKVHETVGDMHMQINDFGKELSFELFYNRAMFESDTAENFLKQYMAIIQEAISEVKGGQS